MVLLDHFPLALEILFQTIRSRTVEYDRTLLLDPTSDGVALFLPFADHLRIPSRILVDHGHTVLATPCVHHGRVRGSAMHTLLDEAE